MISLEWSQFEWLCAIGNVSRAHSAHHLCDERKKESMDGERGVEAVANMKEYTHTHSLKKKKNQHINHIVNGFAIFCCV